MFLLGDKSQANLKQVHPRLVRVVELAIRLTTQDFTVFEGVRSLEQELKNMTNGTSKLSNPADCQHCIQFTNFGHAVDLVPWNGKSAVWDWDKIYGVALAMRNAAVTCCVMIRWGGVWDRTLNDLSTDVKKEVELYKARHRGSDFLDGPHFEIAKSDQIYTYRNQPLTS